MSGTRALAGVVCYAVGLVLAGHGTYKLHDLWGTSLDEMVVAALIGATFGIGLGFVLSERPVLLAAGRRRVGALLPLVGFAILFVAAGAAVYFDRLDPGAQVELLAGGVLTALGGQLYYAAANRVAVDDRLAASDVAIALDAPLSRRARLGAGLVGVAMLVAMLATGVHAARTGDDAGFVTTAIFGGVLLPDFLAPDRVGSPASVLGSERFLVEEGVLGWSGVDTWSEFDGWSEDGDALRIHAGESRWRRIELDPSEPDVRARARSLLAEHLAERTET